MNTGTFSMILFVLIAIVGAYLIFTGAVEGRAKMILIVFIAIITIMLILNLGLFSNSKKIIDSTINATKTDVKALTSYNYTNAFSLSTWIYVNDWNLFNGSDKNIIKRTLGGFNHPRIYLDTYENQLNIDVAIRDATGNYKNVTINIPNINTQKWVNVTCCFSDSNIDTYINGKLVNTYIPTNSLYFSTSIKKDDSSLAFNILPNGKGFSGFLSNTTYYDYFLTPQDSWNIYQKGYSSNILGNYLNKFNASFTFYRDQTQVGQFYIM
jgi:hypothetical protein